MADGDQCAMAADGRWWLNKADNLEDSAERWTRDDRSRTRSLDACGLMLVGESQTLEDVMVVIVRLDDTDEQAYFDVIDIDQSFGASGLRLVAVARNEPFL